ncbi:hypothetical protein PPERSA_06342 [Pseudocohnilembus persalinus]|uniref:Uncharacterized protein n=1 Tax=Pseudocohnilembus persalinus TaxID=266149 RepID=A0A0V0QIK8_PSEPJ|nr:hypothetical protein PPERSA_06342 [Pseudocohnilembus persalinus]|eukprot:KRX02147.1 hypothetical protein PPERSA_06342 [Pseudocohnilembus persalinus]
MSNISGENSMAQPPLPTQIDESQICQQQDTITTQLISNQDKQFSPIEIQNLLNEQVEYLNIQDRKEKCCCCGSRSANFKNKENGINIKLEEKEGGCCGFCGKKYFEMYSNKQRIAKAHQEFNCCCGGNPWFLELENGPSLRSEQKRPGEIHQKKGDGKIKAQDKHFQKNYTLDVKNDGHYCCCLWCTTIACCRNDRKYCCPLECMDKGGSCQLLFCCCVRCCCSRNEGQGCCPWSCMHGDGCMSCCCFCCVATCCPIYREDAHNFIKKKQNCPFCCIGIQSQLQFDQQMTSMDKYTCILQSAML